MTVLANLARLLPHKNDYADLPRTWRQDVLAGITVGVVALPLALAFGISSGVGAAAGLITAVVAGLVAAVFGGSHVQVSGPTGAMAVVLAPIVAEHGLGSIALVTVLAGLLVLAAGVTGLGRAVTFIPWPVIEGFTLGIAAIIFLQQVPAALAQQAPAGERTLLAAFTVVRNADWGEAAKTLAVVGVVAVLMTVLPRVHSGIPASLTAVIVATVFVVALDIPVAAIGELPSHLPAPVLPHVDVNTLRTMFSAALAIAALAAIESLLSARVAATMSPTGPYDPDRELVGQGLASVASGAFGGMPATGAIARTAVNVRSGAATRLSAIVHSLVLLAVVYLATGPVSAIPLSALAGVLMVTSFRMISATTIRKIVRSTRSDALIFVLTAVITVCFDLIEAVEIGILVAAFFALRSVARRSSVVREELPGPRRPGDDQIALLRLDGAMFFGAAERISNAITDAEHPHVSVVIIRMSQLGMLDATGAHTLAEITTELESRGITVIIKGVRPEHMDLLANVGVFESLRHENHLLDSLDDAVAHARTHVARQPH
ncbi:SulP family inorganic anion transporter [Mycolicibacterium goodii]|uniref:SulP family inorganic anion transporter n=1 Tax=Mycolicibacterium goodii TaxID=134601 RepID=A0ABS6HR76_MYCGD|nr:SulP family inorganic anion transporter [Mycolicibacterium goodii]OKH72581.1 MFS transporter [Mycobacterium sp. SWH-M5]MBU8807677.1 SulP family inorganic anion transporter [Mycolicibacterium goodii]MBU8815168.1 SulP family inorganic anion transporter [Mycolicibacterium goodii]MBU8825199.1 SulP family inorganic anion transporter [Mycolicibacterium goodii]MBU8828203.1 SulP family inorganic anion transporter [Mycolicibacterium goodii]